MLRYWLIPTIALLSSDPRAQRTIRVPADAPTIQAGLDIAAAGDTVLVAAGSYRENIRFNGRATVLRSEVGPQRTTIDGSAQRTSVVLFNQREPRNAILEGFRIRGGNAREGGGISVVGASPTIRGNIIEDNLYCGGGGGIGVGFGSPRIENNVIRNNRVAGCSGGTGGGGIVLRGAGSAEVVGNLIERNQHGNRAGGIALFAAGAPRVWNNVIRFNQSHGIDAANNNAGGLVAQNLVHDNTGAGFDNSSILPIINNTFANNGGPALQVFSLAPTLVLANNIFATPAGGRGIVCRSTGSQPNMAHNLVWAPGGQAYVNCPDQTGQNGNLNVDPGFEPRMAFRLSRRSPAVDAGSNSAPRLPAADPDGDARRIDGDLDSVATVDIGYDEQSGNRPFALGCAGSGRFVPKIRAVGSPIAGRSVTISVSQALGGARAVLILGLSRDRWQGGALPYPLDAFGMAGCSLAVSMDACIYTTTAGRGPGNGTSGAAFVLPNLPSTRGTRAYAQWLIADPGPRPVPGVLSNAIEIEVL